MAGNFLEYQRVGPRKPLTDQYFQSCRMTWTIELGLRGSYALWAKSTIIFEHMGKRDCFLIHQNYGKHRKVKKNGPSLQEQGDEACQINAKN